MMNREIVTYVLTVGLFLSVLILAGAAKSFHLPGNQQDYDPDQPIAFSHRLHAGELSISCLYCHYGAEQSKHAGVPAANVCMNCHKFVTAPLASVRDEEEKALKEGRKSEPVLSPEIAKVYEALGLNDRFEKDAAKKERPIEWVKVHNLPDFVAFDHRAHVVAGVECGKCHGPVETMETVRQIASLSMGWCVNCHRTAKEEGIGGQPVDPSVDCTTCHY